MDRVTIVSGLRGILEGVTKEKGFQTDIGKNVYVWKVNPFETEYEDTTALANLPCVSINDTTETSDYGEESPIGFKKVTQLVQLVAYNTESADYGRNAIADIKRVLDESEYLSGALDDLRVVTTDIGVEQDRRIHVVSLVVLECEYITNK